MILVDFERGPCLRRNAARASFATAMKLRSAPRLAGLIAIALLGACTCHTETAASKAAAKADPGKAPTKVAPTKADPPTKADAPNPDAPNPDAPKPAGDAADPLGERFVDPLWFRKEMLGADAKAMDVSRSGRNEQGLFSSQILFELPAGTTPEQCADKLEAKVKPDVANLLRAADEKAPGRLKLTGDTDRYRVTMMCGEAKGVMRAYVGYEWLN